jgi:hypothetical protein
VTAVNYPALRCDAPDPDEADEADGQCSTEWGSPVYVANSTELRARLKESGWLQPRPGRDICPNCAEKGLR